ncbi:MAG: CPBP family intramembrane metalloprotease [Anaerolineae bacterium]|nr:CPBP family intramembrane metalloprotease [Anaerolineae bacterium]
MDFFLLLVGGGALFYVGLLLYLANMQDVARQRLAQQPEPAAQVAIAMQQRATLVRWMSAGIAAMVFVYGLLVLQIAAVSTSTELLSELELEMPPIDQTGALINFIIALVFAVFSLRVLLSETTRQSIRRRLGMNDIYDPESSVHNVAIVLALAFLSVSIGQLIVSGGVAGMAQDIEMGGISTGLLVFQTLLLIALAFLGVGMAIRRDMTGSLARLGLRIPTSQDVIWGVGVGVSLYVLLLILVTLWAAFVPPEQLEQQSAASEQIAQIFNTIPLALLISASAAISEEILFRGALQPVFGLPLSSVFFALVHMQYALTPATIIIFIVSLGLGWLRQRQSTTAAIIAHFVYNFVQLLLAILAASIIGGGQP